MGDVSCHGENERVMQDQPVGSRHGSLVDRVPGQYAGRHTDQDEGRDDEQDEGGRSEPFYLVDAQMLSGPGRGEDGSDGEQDGGRDDDDEAEHHVAGRDVLRGDAQADDGNGQPEVRAEEVARQHLGS